MINLGAGLQLPTEAVPPMLICVVMFGCIIAGSLCLIVSVLHGIMLYISCGLSAVKINEELLVLNY